MQAVALFQEMLLKEIHPDVMVFNAVMNVGERRELPKRHAKNRGSKTLMTQYLGGSSNTNLWQFLWISLVIAYCLTPLKKHFFLAEFCGLFLFSFWRAKA